MEARRQFQMWKNAKDGFKRNPIDPNYQVTFIAFGMNDKDDLEFLKKILKLEDGKDQAWTVYKERLAKAKKFYYSHVLKKNSSYLMGETEYLQKER